MRQLCVTFQKVCFAMEKLFYTDKLCKDVRTSFFVCILPIPQIDLNLTNKYIKYKIIYDNKCIIDRK